MGGFGFPTEPAVYREPVPAQAMFELRPLSTGEILDRTFALYRQRFWLYVGLSAITAAITTLISFVQISMGLVGKAPMTNPDAAAAMKLGLTTLVVTSVALILHLLAYAITQAATVSAVESNYLGRETSIGAALGAVQGKWYRYIGVTLWQAWSVSWPMLVVVIPAAVLGVMVGRGGGRAAVFAVIGVVALLLLPAFVLGFILYLRNSLGIVACVSEGLGVVASMKRSKFLVADHKTRAFLLYLLMFVLALVAGGAQGIFNLFLISSHGALRVGFEISSLLVTFISASLVQPVGAIAFVLFYIDQRVRKEGFDVEMLLSKVTGEAMPVRELESPFGTALPGMESPFSSPLRASASAPASVNSESPFGSGPLPGSSGAEREE